MWELVSREHPFDEYPQAQTGFMIDLEDAIIKGNIRPSIEKYLKDKVGLYSSENECNKEYAKLYAKCVHAKQLERPTFSRICASLTLIETLMSDL